MTEKIIKDIYYNPIAGFGSIQDTFKQAKKIDSSITYDDVKNFMNKLSHKQTHLNIKVIILLCHHMLYLNWSAI